VSGYDPDFGPHPSPELIGQLLDALIAQTPFRCIMTYGMLNGLDATFAAAQTRGLKVTAIIWLDTDAAVNANSIALGIEKAKQYPNTITRLSCGSEVRTRHGAAIAEPIIHDCITQVKTAGVVQPLTSIDTWWQYCNESINCQPRAIAAELDWIGVNIFPWWEDKYSGLYPCTSAAQAADFHIARLQGVMALYPGKEVVPTELGWPALPSGYTETNIYTGQQCGVASQANQSLVVQQTLAKLIEDGYPGTIFSAFREPYKARVEGPEGPGWGICEGVSPYTCHWP
jgi:exo-beta-1,3-glucanase (GH17 family)